MCRIATLGFALLYVAALALFVIGTFGLLGQESDPLAGIFLIPLGMPWSLVVDQAPAAAWPWLAALAPLPNALLLGAACRYLRRRAVSGGR